MKALKRLVLISRPAGYPVKLAVFLAGAVAGGAAWSIQGIVGAFFVTFPLSIYVYGLNDIADRESDEINVRKGGAHGAIVREDETRLIVGVAVISFASYLVFLLATGHIGSALGWLGIGLFGYAYSFRPLRFKSRPILDSIFNGFWALSIVMTGYWAGTHGLHFPWPAAHLVVAVIWGTATVHALGSLPDYDVDRAAGDKTIAVLLGKPVTYGLCAISFAIIAFLLRTHIAYAIYLDTCAFLSFIGIRYSSPRIARYIFSAVIMLFPFAFVARLAFNA